MPRRTDRTMDMRDIAKLAGVSSATVSRVINGSSLVRPETVERVRKVIEEVKFFPNNSATTLKYGRSGTYGLIIPDITNPFFPEFIKCFEAIVVENDKEMLMATTDFHSGRMQQSIRRMLVRKVDGVALLASEIETEPFEDLIQNRVPLVTMDRGRTANGLTDVSIIGFDDIEMSDIVHPPLTTLRLPRFELAKAFFDALEHLKNNPHAQGEQHNVKTTLVVRESTGPAPKRRSK